MNGMGKRNVANEIMNVATAARTLGLSVRRVRQLLESKSLEGQKLDGTWIVFTHGVRDRLMAREKDIHNT